MSKASESDRVPEHVVKAMLDLNHQQEDSVMSAYRMMSQFPGIGDMGKRMMVETVIHHERKIVNMQLGNAGKPGAWSAEILQTEYDRYLAARKEAEVACGPHFEAWYAEQRDSFPQIDLDALPHRQ